jgi:co-chaperonin GroES (HSP10)
MVNNTSGIHPKGHRVLILPDPVEEVTQSGIILSVGENRDRERLAQLKGTVIEIGNSAWHDQPSPWAEIGDHVIFGKYSGLIYQGDDDKEYRIINDLDVVALVN